MENSFTSIPYGIFKVNQCVVQNYLKYRKGYHRDLHDILLTYSSFFTKLFTEPCEMEKVQRFGLEFAEDHFKLVKHIITDSKSDQNGEPNPFIIPKSGDNRFKALQWTQYPFFDYIKQLHLLMERLALKITDEVEMGEPGRRKIDFYTKQYTDLFSPANFLFTNPEALEKAWKSRGESLLNGFHNYVNDVEKGRISQADKSAFEVGRNLAITPGSVIYQNELIQLIQYKPATSTVYEMPLLIIPPWINKYYVLDLQPENSFVKFMVDQGFSVFIISWRNPSKGMGDLTFEDYVNQGALTAIEIVKIVCGINKINVLGYCLGGTLLSIAASILAARENEEISSLTFLSAMVDFSDIGPMGDVINSSLVNKLERGELLRDGLMHGHDMERAFNLIRAKDMVWCYAVDNYLKGMSAPVSDVMYWNNDNTNLPAKMYIYYMKEMILKNKLRPKNALRICGIKIDIGKIKEPVFVIAMKKDYISPPATVFATTELVSGPVEFILGESGHVMGVANPPSRKKYGHYLGGNLGNGYEEWLKTATFQEGSWWKSWSQKLKGNSGKLVPAPKISGNNKFKVIEPAPGKYVKEKC